MNINLIFVVILLLLGLTVGISAANVRHEKTDWRLTPSLKYDVLCALNIISGDPFYTQYYPKETKRLNKLLTPEAREAIGTLRTVIKEEQGGIISASLCWCFSAIPDSTLDQMLATTSTPETTKKAFAKTGLLSEEEITDLSNLSENLHIVLQWMKDTGFDTRWHKKIEPIVEKSIKRISKNLNKYNVIQQDEAVLGHGLASNQITVYLLYYCQPHGIRITGINFLTDQSYPFEIVVRNATHEMLHPPCDLKTDKELLTALETLKQDTFLMDKFEHHDPSFGYNDFIGYIEEDCVQALEQVASRNMNIANEPKARWKESDGGMHVFAVALYSLMIKHNYNVKDEDFRDFLLLEINSGELGAGHIQTLYDEFYSKK